MNQNLNFMYADLLQRNYLRNRTIVSSDILPMLEDIAQTVGHGLILHTYKSGSDIGTWIIPSRWDVNEAWLKGPDGKIIASYEDHPLFAVPYTLPFSGIVDLETLKKHVRLHPTQDEAFFYEYRFAYNYQMRMSDWAITLPRNVLSNLPEGKYTIHLDYDIQDGEMLVGELCLPGKTDQCIALLADYCHPGQVNDSFSGILAMLDVFRRLKEMTNRKYTYRLFFFPETIGSCVLLHKRPDYLESTILSIFSEFVGWGQNWKVLASRGNNILSEKLGQQIAMLFDDVKLDNLECGYSNDEVVFDFAGIPSMSIQMFKCDECHSSLDRPELIKKENLDKAANIIFRICWMMENNRILNYCQKVPVYLTRFDLYSDAVNEPEDFEKKQAILYGIRNRNSLLDIASANDIDFEYVRLFAEQLTKQGLVLSLDNI